MSIEKAFGIFKRRWRILLKNRYVTLNNSADLVITCVCLYNLCIGFGDHFDMDKANDAHVEA